MAAPVRVHGMAPDCWSVVRQSGAAFIIAFAVFCAGGNPLFRMWPLCTRKGRTAEIYFSLFR